MIGAAKGDTRSLEYRSYGSKGLEKVQGLGLNEPSALDSDA